MNYHEVGMQPAASSLAPTSNSSFKRLEGAVSRLSEAVYRAIGVNERLVGTLPPNGPAQTPQASSLSAFDRMDEISSDLDGLASRLLQTVNAVDSRV